MKGPIPDPSTLGDTTETVTVSLAFYFEVMSCNPLLPLFELTTTMDCVSPGYYTAC
jgi:hypothetical protein